MWAPRREPGQQPADALVRGHRPARAPARCSTRARLIESRPFLTRIPDDSVIVTDRVPTSVPGAGRYRFVATRDAAGSYAMVYAPVGPAVQGAHGDDRGPEGEGLVVQSAQRPGHGHRRVRRTRASAKFTPPDPGEMLDWVLVLDDAAKDYPPPGKTKRN